MDMTVVPALALTSVCFLVAVWNTSVGPSGAVTFATMATTLPPTAVVPIHAVVEFAAAIVRVVTLQEFINWHYVRPFVAGGAIGMIAAMPFFFMNLVQDRVLEVILGGFILAATWLPLASLPRKLRPNSTVDGAASSFLTLFIGATGALVTACIAAREADHRRVLGTTATCMAFQHGIKVPFFGIIGFSYQHSLPLLVLLTTATIAGAWLGKRILVAVPIDLIRSLFRWVVTILGIKLVLQGLFV